MNIHVCTFVLIFTLHSPLLDSNVSGITGCQWTEDRMREEKNHLLKPVLMFSSPSWQLCCRLGTQRFGEFTFKALEGTVKAKGSTNWKRQLLCLPEDFRFSQTFVYTWITLCRGITRCNWKFMGIWISPSGHSCDQHKKMGCMYFSPNSCINKLWFFLLFLLALLPRSTVIFMPAGALGCKWSTVS